MWFLEELRFCTLFSPFLSIFWPFSFSHLFLHFSPIVRPSKPPSATASLSSLSYPSYTLLSRLNAPLTPFTSFGRLNQSISTVLSAKRTTRNFQPCKPHFEKHSSVELRVAPWPARQNLQIYVRILVLARARREAQGARKRQFWSSSTLYRV